MAYEFKGQLTGLLCGECSEPLSGMVVRLYASRHVQAANLAAADPKETFRVLSDAQVSEKAQLLVGEGKTDASGSFSITLDEKQYDGGAFEVDVYCPTVPGRRAEPAPTPVQLSITTLAPRWRETESGLVAAWAYQVPHRYWCRVRGLFDAWVICGRVLVCGAEAPVAGVSVVAFDRDWIQDDALGSGTTDSNGRFRIDYIGADFRKTPFAWFSSERWEGPDLYFRVETPGKVEIYTEPASFGRTAERENVGHCACVKVCIPADNVPKDPPTEVIPIFTHVGNYKVANPGSSFTADGVTTGENAAFTGSIPLRGLVPNGDEPNAIEYHFRVAAWDPTGTTLGPAVDVEPASMPACVIGQLEYWTWDGANSVWRLETADWWINNPGVTPVQIFPVVGPPQVVVPNTTIEPGGWVKVPRNNALTFGGTGKFVGGFGNLAVLDTKTLTSVSFDLVNPPPVLEAGTPVPVGKQTAGRLYEITFEARKVLGHASVSGNALTKIAVCNSQYFQRHHPGWAGYDASNHSVGLLDIAELAGPGAGCGKITSTVTALVTAYHPYLGSAEVYFEGNGPLPAPINLPVTAGSASGPALPIDVSTLQPCAYILWFRATTLLTSGNGLINGSTFYDHVAFCKG